MGRSLHPSAANIHQYIHQAVLLASMFKDVHQDHTRTYQQMDIFTVFVFKWNFFGNLCVSNESGLNVNSSSSCSPLQHNKLNTAHLFSQQLPGYDQLLLQRCSTPNPFGYVIALFILCLYCCTCIGAPSDVLILESHNTFKKHRLSAFC